MCARYMRPQIKENTLEEIFRPKIQKQLAPELIPRGGGISRRRVAKCSNRWRASCTSAGKINPLVQASTVFILEGARREEKSRRGREKSHLRGRGSGRLPSFGDIYSEMSRDAANFFVLFFRPCGESARSYRACTLCRSITRGLHGG